MTRGERAKELFTSGYNCSQSVIGAFADKLSLPFDTLMAISSSFGGGIGRLREVCGTVSGGAMVLGLRYGGYAPKDNGEKAKHYKRVQEFAERFKKENGSYICRELLGLDEKKSDYVPEKRTEQYYKKRPCGELCRIAADILDELMNEIDSGKL